MEFYSNQLNYVSNQINEILSSKASDYLFMNIAEPCATRYERMLDYCNSADWDNDPLKIIIQMMGIVSINEIYRDMEIGHLRISEWPMRYYCKCVQRIFSCHGLSLTSQYMPSEQEVHRYQQKIQHDIKNREETAVFLHSIKELVQSHSQITHMVPIIERLHGDAQKTNWSGIAKFAGGGAMTVINPLIGIPVLINSVFQAIKSDQHNNRVYQQFCDGWQSYLNNWDGVMNNLHALIAVHEEYYRQQVIKMLTPPLTSIFSNFIAEGQELHEISDYFPVN